MAQRVATAAVLIVFLIVMMYFGGVVMGIGAMVCLCFAMHEEYHALSVAGHRPVAWPTWVATAACVPLVAAWGIGTVIPLLAMTCLITIICVVFRDEPEAGRRGDERAAAFYGNAAGHVHCCDGAGAA